MLAGWRHAYANLALTGGNLLFLLIALRSPTPGGMALAAGLVGLSRLYAWHVNLRRHSAVADTPTSHLVSAPQGFVEVIGKGVHPPGARLVSPVSGLPCLWYRYIIEEKQGNKWRRVNSGLSTEEFGLDDGTDRALVDPDAAEIITSNKQVTIRGSYRYTEWTLIEGEPLYVLGEHVAIGGDNAALDFRRDVSDLLAKWKEERPALLHRFDVDGDGAISLEEWESARLAAKQQVENDHLQIRLEKTGHLLRKPDGRPYLIANRTPEGMAARYRKWAWVHLGLIVSACIALASLL